MRQTHWYQDSDTVSLPGDRSDLGENIVIDSSCSANAVCLSRGRGRETYRSIEVSEVPVRSWKGQCLQQYYVRLVVVQQSRVTGGIRHTLRQTQYFRRDLTDWLTPPVELQPGPTQKSDQHAHFGVPASQCLRQPATCGPLLIGQLARVSLLSQKGCFRKHSSSFLSFFHQKVIHSNRLTLLSLARQSAPAPAPAQPGPIGAALTCGYTPGHAV